MEQDTRASARRRWAVFESHEEGFQCRFSRWMEREEADDVLTSLLEDGESCVFLVPWDELAERSE